MKIPKDLQRHRESHPKVNSQKHSRNLLFLQPTVNVAMQIVNKIDHLDDLYSSKNGGFNGFDACRHESSLTDSMFTSSRDMLE